MATQRSRWSVFRQMLAGAVLGGLVLAAGAGDYYDQYGLTSTSPAVDLGVQPLGYPSGVVSTVMRHDRLLREALAAQGRPLATHAFLRGADMLPLLADARLEAGLLGDMPTLLAAAAGDVVIVGLVKQTSTAIVARGVHQVRGLAGKRIAYVEASSAHQTLLQGLKSVGLGESDVQLVRMRVDAMPEALQRGEIDAFAAWEPGPALALAADTRNRIVFRGQSSDYFVLQREFVTAAPAAAEVLVAGYLRAIEWMRVSQKNLERAAQWAKDEAAAFSGKASPLPLAQIVAITRRELLNVPSAPVIIVNPKVSPPLLNEFTFLRRLDKLPASSNWDNVLAAMASKLLTKVQADPVRYQWQRYDYED